MPQNDPWQSTDTTLDALLALLGSHLKGHPGLLFEWSLRVGEGGVSTSDRVSCWLEAKSGGRRSFAALERLLAAIAAPPAVRRAQERCSSRSRLQGIGLSAGAAGIEWRLYLSHGDAHTGDEKYDTLRWIEGAESLESAAYHFHHLPETPGGETPTSFVHPRLESALAELLEHERLQQLGGFWIRRRAEAWDQVDLAFPWHPPLGEFAATLGRVSAELGAPSGWIERYAGHPLRHIAFSGPGRPPHCTIYFSAAAGERWPSSLAELQTQVQGAAVELHELLEWQFFADLPPAPPALPFAEDADLETWRRALGPALYEHCGLFDDPASPARHDEKVERAQEKAVQELCRFLPSGGEVYMLGCGWGGATELLRRRGFAVTGVTPRRAQYRHCAGRGQVVRLGDLERTLPTGRYDAVLILESLGELRDRPRLFRMLRLFAGRLVMRLACPDASALRAELEAAGWQVGHWRDRRRESLPTFQAWRRRLESLEASGDERFAALCAAWERQIAAAEAQALIEVVAD